MGRYTGHLDHVPAPAHPRRRRTLGWLAAGEPNEDRALAYGFFAIGAFVFGGVGYLSEVLSGWGLAANVLMALIAFALCCHHMEGS
jgi:hypothetical protein